MKPTQPARGRPTYQTRPADKGSVAPAQAWQTSGLGSSRSAALLLRKEICALGARGSELSDKGHGGLKARLCERPACSA